MDANPNKEPKFSRSFIRVFVAQLTGAGRRVAQKSARPSTYQRFRIFHERKNGNISPLPPQSEIRFFTSSRGRFECSTDEDRDEVIHLDDNVAMQNGETVGHLCRNLDVVLFQLLVHAEQKVVSRSIAACMHSQKPLIWTGNNRRT